jgi:hypothetical protein
MSNYAEQMKNSERLTVDLDSLYETIGREGTLELLREAYVFAQCSKREKELRDQMKNLDDVEKFAKQYPKQIGCYLEIYRGAVIKNNVNGQ